MELKEFFAAHPRAALAYSGGVDSAYLLYAGLSAGAELRPYYVSSPFQPEFERRDALRLAESLGVSPRIIRLNVLDVEKIRENPAERCYYCKRQIMGSILELAAREGFDTLLDGTNASDDAGDRPGMRALRELKVLSPLRLCGLSKPQIRRLSREAGLFTWNKPAYACLATRIPTGEEITAEKLCRVEKSEDFLFSLGFKDFRVRMRGGGALLQITARQREKAEAEWENIKAGLSPYFETVRLDDKEREESI